MKRYAKNFLSVLLVLSFISLGCASTKKTVAKETKPAQAEKSAKTTKVAKAGTAAKQDPNAGNAAAQKTTAAPKESAVTKSAAQDKEIDELMKKYSTTAEQKAKTETKRIAPDFKLQDINYDTYSLSDYKGKQPVLLIFWIIQCSFCESELQILNGRYPKLVEDGLEVFAINVGDSMDAVSDYIKGLGVSLKVLSDQVTSVASAYKTSGAPTYVLVNKDGYIVFQDNIFPNQYKDLLSAKETPK